MDQGVALRTERLTKRYGDLVAVHELTLAVYHGEILGLLGPNGAGKTTSIQMICGLLQPDSGLVAIGGQMLKHGQPSVSSQVGLCPQQNVLWQKLTCLEQLEFIGEMHGLARAEARQRGLALLEAMGLAEKRDQLARSLSGGMQRRLSLIMALVHDPQIVVLDEPEAGLDPQSRVMVRDFIRSLARDRGKAVILTTHNMDEADRMADRLAIMDRGTLLLTDTPEALKRRVGATGVLQVDMPGQTDPEAVRAAMRAAGLQPGEIRQRQSTLEDVFLALTGRGLRE